MSRRAASMSAAKAEVHRLLFELAERGTAVLVISSDLPEVLALADRVIVMAQGRIAGELAGPRPPKSGSCTWRRERGRQQSRMNAHVRTNT